MKLRLVIRYSFACGRIGVSDNSLVHRFNNVWHSCHSRIRFYYFRLDDGLLSHLLSKVRSRRTIGRVHFPSDVYSLQPTSVRHQRVWRRSTWYYLSYGLASELWRSHQIQFTCQYTCPAYLSSDIPLILCAVVWATIGVVLLKISDWVVDKKNKNPSVYFKTKIWSNSYDWMIWNSISSGPSMKRNTLQIQVFGA